MFLPLLIDCLNNFVEFYNELRQPALQLIFNFLINTIRDISINLIHLPSGSYIFITNSRLLQHCTAL